MGSDCNAGLVCCVVGVWIFWSLHDYLQERVFAFPDFHFGFFMALVLQLTSTALSAAQHVISARCGGERAPDRGQGVGLLASSEGGADASAGHRVRLLLYYLLLSLLIAASNGMATAALNYVSMQVKVLVKSGKIISVMIIGGCCFGRHYEPAEYGYMVLVALGLSAFFLAGRDGALHSSLVGGSLLFSSLCSDSLVPNVQQRLLQELGQTKAGVIFYTNLISAAMTLALISCNGELRTATAYLGAHRRAALLLLLQSVAGYGGILAYMETVRRFGSKMTTLITSSRKLFTIFLSAVLFRHVLTGFHLVGILAVFAGVLLNAFGGRACSRYLMLLALALTTCVVVTEVTVPSAPNASVATSPSRAAMPVRGRLYEVLSHRVYDPPPLEMGWLHDVKAERAKLGMHRRHHHTIRHQRRQPLPSNASTAAQLRVRAAAAARRKQKRKEKHQGQSQGPVVRHANRSSAAPLPRARTQRQKAQQKLEELKERLRATRDERLAAGTSDEVSTA